jgi:hypothetical protein
MACVAVSERIALDNVSKIIVIVVMDVRSER